MTSTAGSPTPSGKRVGRAAVVTHGRPGQIGAGFARLQAVAQEHGVELVLPPDEAEKHGVDESDAAQAADIALDCSIDQEACSLGLAPTASTTAMLALGDALAMALSEKRGFKEEDFAHLHPGGKLGKKLARVSQLMHSGDSVPRVARTTKMADVIYEMSRKGLGITTVVEDNKLLGVISDGDLRRLLEKRKDVLNMTAGECVTANPKTIRPEEFAMTALNIMEQKKITSLVVTQADATVVGIIHLHDLWGTQMV